MRQKTRRNEGFVQSCPLSATDGNRTDSWPVCFLLHKPLLAVPASWKSHSLPQRGLLMSLWEDMSLGRWSFPVPFGCEPYTCIHPLHCFLWADTSVNSGFLKLSLFFLLCFVCLSYKPQWFVFFFFLKNWQLIYQLNFLLCFHVSPMGSLHMLNTLNWLLY